MNANVRSAVAGAVAGGVVMYLLDPDRGARRRALVRDKAVWAARKTRDAAGATRRDVSNRLSGLAARTRVKSSGERAHDTTVRERVRGVEAVDDQLRTHATAEGIPARRGDEDGGQSWAAWATSGWSPAALAGTAAGVALLGAAALAAGRTGRTGGDVAADPFPVRGLEGDEVFLVGVESLP